MDTKALEAELLKELYKIGAIKFGSFKLKSGIISPIYIDLRVTISYPVVLKQIADLMWKRVEGKSQFDFICGVPYTALPFASCISLVHNVPMLIRRKEGAKDYGTKKLIEGVYQKGSPIITFTKKPGQSCLILEDLVTTGGSVLEVHESLVSEGLLVKDVVVVLDREQGAKKTLESKGLNLYSIFTMSQILELLESQNILPVEKVNEIRNFIQGNQTQQEAPKPKALSYQERSKLCSSSMSSKLLDLMETKKSNLALAADVTTKSELLKLADLVGPEIIMLKTHIDIITDFDSDLTVQLENLAKKHNFLIFEDRKFADIGNTVKSQYESGPFHIAKWSDIIDAHVVPGPGIIEGLKQVGKPMGKGLLLLAEMSSEGNLATGSYTESALQMAEKHKDFVIGFISRKKLSADPTFVHCTPGVQLQAGKDNLGQQYLTPEEVIAKQGSDVIIVGRGIFAAENPQEVAKKYKEAGWNAYLSRLN